MVGASDTIPALFLKTVANFGNRPAVIGPELRITYSELRDRILRAGAALTACGVARGDRVAVWLPNGVEFIEAALATALLGASLVPLSTRLKGREVGYILGKAKPAALIGVGHFLGTDFGAMLAEQDIPSLKQKFRVGPGRADWVDWSEAIGGPVQKNLLEKVAEIAQSIGGDEISEIMFTSGTTGFPKGAMLRHSQIVRTYKMWAHKLGLGYEDRYLVIAPMFHSYGYKAGVIASIATGTAMYPLQMFDAAHVLGLIEEERINGTGGPPTIFLSLLAENEIQRRDLSSLRSVSTGGSMVPESMIRALQRLGVETVLNAYGLTEATALVTLTSPEDDPELIASTAGRAIDGVEVRCVGIDGRPVAPGDPGEIEVRGYNVMAGYFEDPEATRQAMTQDGWLRTGDVGVLDARGYLRVTDRIKDMFIVGGFNCYPAEIEQIMMQYPMVDQVAVIGIPDARMGEVGKAFIVPKRGANFVAADFLSWCRHHMANYKVPRDVEIVAALPRNAMGKIQKFLLRNALRSAEEGTRAETKPITAR